MTVKPLTVKLPWPPKELSPNARVHWAKKAKAAKAYKQACFVLAKNAGLSADWEGDIHLWITFYPPDRRSRDDDNLVASLKNGRDGLALAMGIDDKRFRLHPWVTDTLGGYVEVRLSPGPEGFSPD